MRKKCENLARLHRKVEKLQKNNLRNTGRWKSGVDHNIPNLSCKCTSFFDPTILCCNLEIRPQQTFYQGEKNEWRTYDDLCRRTCFWCINKWVDQNKLFNHINFNKGRGQNEEIICPMQNKNSSLWNLKYTGWIELRRSKGVVKFRSKVTWMYDLDILQH